MEKILRIVIFVIIASTVLEAVTERESCHLENYHDDDKDDGDDNDDDNYENNDDDQKESDGAAQKLICNSRVPDNYFVINTKYNIATALDMSGVDLFELKNKYFNGLANLKKITLDENSMQSLEDEVFKPLPNLEEIDLQNNRLATMNFDQFFHNPKLKELNLENNNISTIEPIKNINISIENLDLAGNNLVDISELRKMEKLKILDLSDNKIQKLSDKSFYGLNNLKTLDLQNNEIAELDDGVFKPLANVEEINLENNHLTTIKLDQCANSLKLKNLNLRNNSIITIESIESTNISIEELDLGDNRIKNLQSKSLNGLGAMKTLNLQNNEIVELGDGVFKTLTSLEAIDLENNKLITINFDQFASNSKLKTIIFKENNISTIEPIESTTISLNELDLTENKVKDISELCKLKNLETLFLSNNTELDYDSFSISCLNNLESLKLDNTEMSQLDYDKQTFGNLTNLKILNLDGNSLVTFPGNHFSNQSKLADLSIRRNNLSDINATVIISTFVELRNVYLSENPLNCIMRSEFYDTDIKVDVKSFEVPTCRNQFENVNYKFDYDKSIKIRDILSPFNVAMIVTIIVLLAIILTIVFFPKQQPNNEQAII